MLSKLTALLALVLFIVLAIVGIFLNLALTWNFDLSLYFQYLLLFIFLVLFLGKPVVKLAMDLIHPAYRENDDHFKVPASKLAPDKKPKSGSK